MNVEKLYDQAAVDVTFRSVRGTLSQSLALRERLSGGLNPNLRNSDGDTLLHDAVLHRHHEAQMLLLAYGANPNLQNKDGRTPAHMLFSDHPTLSENQTFGLLVARGADLTIKDNAGWSPDVPFSEYFVETGSPPHGLRYAVRQRPVAAATPR